MPGRDGDDWEAFEEKATEIDGHPVVPEAVPRAVEPTTPRPETTGAHRISSHEFATAVDLADRDAYARGLEHGRRAAVAEAEAAAVTEARRIREECVEAFRSFYVIWYGSWPATWEEAEAWYRGRLPPI